MPVISVIVLSYNRPHHLEMCLESLARQKQVVDFEVIVADAGSTTGNCELAVKFGSRLPVLKVMMHQHVTDDDGKDIYTCAATANMGRSVAEGRIIQYLQHDHILSPMYLMHLLNIFELTPPALAPQGICVTGLASYLTEEVELRDLEALCRLEVWWAGYPRWVRFMGWGQKALAVPESWEQLNLIRSPDWRGIDGFDCAVRAEHDLPLDENFRGQGHEHMDWVYRLAQNGVKFVVSPLLRHYHQAHLGTDTRPAEQWEEELAKSTAYFSGKHGADAWGKTLG